MQSDKHRVLAALTNTPASTAEISEKTGLALHRSTKALHNLKSAKQAFNPTKGFYRLPQPGDWTPKVKPVTGTGIRNLLSEFANAVSKLHALFVEKNEKSPYITSMAPDAEWTSGSMHMQTRPLAATWKDGVEKTSTDIIDGTPGKYGWAKGIRYRMTAEPVWVPVNDKGESIERFAKPRKVKQ